MPLDNSADDGKSQPGAACSARTRAITASEALEQHTAQGHLAARFNSTQNTPDRTKAAMSDPTDAAPDPAANPGDTAPARAITLSSHRRWITPALALVAALAVVIVIGHGPSEEPGQEPYRTHSAGADLI